MRPFKLKERERAIGRGMEFLYRVACDDEYFSLYGHDLLNCFYFISATSLDPALRQTARRFGRECARLWRRTHSSLPRDADAGTVSEYIHGSYAADRLGLRDAALKTQLRRAAKNISALDYFWFDPVN